MQNMLIKVVSIFLGSIIVITNIKAETLPNQLPKIVIEGKELNKSLTTPSIESAKKRIRKIPGGVNIVSEDVIRKGNTRSLEEALALTPGLYVRSRFGSDEVRLSIRGSGISQTFNARGIRILRDGLPISEADGNVRPQLVDTLNAQYIEVFRGANALEYGSASLGGAINLISPNALTAKNYPLRIEIGSNNYLRGQVTHGLVVANGMDFYSAVTGIEQNGFRENSEQETVRYYGNMGKRWNEQKETRIHLELQDNNIELPGSLTKQQLEDDPTQANRGSLLRNSQRDINQFRITAQHSVVLKNGLKADFGASYQHLDTTIPLSFAFLEADQNDASISGRVVQDYVFYKKNHNIIFGGVGVWGDNEGDRFDYAFADKKGRQIRDDDDNSWGIELFAQDRFEINDVTEMIVGMQLIHAKRKTSETPILLSGDKGESLNRSKKYTGFNPRLGFIQNIQDDLYIFGNISRSYEPPTVSEFSALRNDGLFEILDAQDATTLEIGIRTSRAQYFNYEIVAYYSEVNNEILTQEDPSLPSGSGETIVTNADNTTHSGIEAGLDVDIAKNINVVMSYTYNNFKFNNDDLFSNNQIPGIPRHLLHAEIMFESSEGLFFGPTIDHSSSWYVDFANTVRTDSYTIFGAKLGYTYKNDLRFFAQIVNLADEVYASNTDIVDIADENSAIFNPGLERSLFFGVELGR